MESTILRIDDVRVAWEDDGELQRCQAVAEISYAINDCGDRRIEWLYSGGLNGISLAGSDDPHRQIVELEQLDELRDHLRVFGVDTRDFAARFAPALQE
jgi:hypothetical protein